MQPQLNPQAELDKYAQLVKSSAEISRKPIKEDFGLFFATKGQEGLGHVTLKYVLAWKEYKQAVGEELALSFVDFCCYCGL